jgi:flagellar biogenesis protein FliO
MNPGRGTRTMELVETLNLGGKRQLMLVVCDGKRYLIGAGGDSVTSIQQVTRSADELTGGRELHSACEEATPGMDAGRLH